MKVICNCAGQNPECKNCGASKPHDNDSCEPCPIIKEARCVPCGQHKTLENNLWRLGIKRYDRLANSILEITGPTLYHIFIINFNFCKTQVDKLEKFAQKYPPKLILTFNKSKSVSDLAINYMVPADKIIIIY
jgi:hypothetical protein